MKNKRNKNLYQKGITLIALVVTIVVLLILAGITITFVLGDNGIINMAKRAAEQTNEAVKKEQADFKDITDQMQDYLNGSSGKIPEGLEVGSSVTYNLVGDDYIWNKEYATSDQIGTETLSSKTGGAFRLTQWKVLDINKTTKEVTLVPTKTTQGEDGTSGTVRLQGAQGYNNSVKLLNDACSKLYGNEAKGIKARSINIKDIEDHMTEPALTSARGTTYNQQVANPYTSAYSKYPVIYAQEIDAVIATGSGTGSRNTTGLGLSDPPANFIARSEGTASATVPGAITTATSIQPCQTYWYGGATFMQTAFDEHTKKDNTKVNYYSLIMPQNTSTTYWVASRCVNTISVNCAFCVRHVGTGGVGANVMYVSTDGANNGALALFPVVTLSSDLIKTDTEGNFAVQL